MHLKFANILLYFVNTDHTIKYVAITCESGLPSSRQQQEAGSGDAGWGGAKITILSCAKLAKKTND